MIAAHSEHVGTEDRGRYIGTLHGLPMQQTPTQETMSLPAACPDWHDYREEVAGTMKHSPGSVHRVYAEGKIIADIPAGPRDWQSQRFPCISTANRLASQLRKQGKREVYVDGWLSEAHASSAYRSHDAAPVTATIYRESAEAAGYEYDDERAGMI